MSKFRKASSKCVIQDRNNAPSEADGFDFKFEGGICCGMTVTWIVGVVNGYAAAGNAEEFGDYFTNVLRFQGAYLQAARRKEHNIASNEFKMQKLASVMAINVTQFDEQSVIADKIAEITRRHDGVQVWAAYISIFHHAIGVAKIQNSYCIMDPNEGLYAYDKFANFSADLCKHLKLRAQRTDNKMNKQFRIVFYKS